MSRAAPITRALRCSRFAYWILRLGATAAIEIRYFPRGRCATFVLNRRTTGWQAVAIVPGGPLPIA